MAFALKAWQVLGFKNPEQCDSWKPQGVEGFHMGLAPEHYWCYQKQSLEPYHVSIEHKHTHLLLEECPSWQSSI